MRLVDYLNREIERSEKYDDPSEHLEIISELKEDYFGVEPKAVDLLRQCRDYLIPYFEKDRKTRKLMMMIDVILAKENNK